MTRAQMTTRQAREHDVAEQLQTFDIDLLSAIARGEVDAVALARKVLASRGLSPAGQWVGFTRAQQMADAYRH